MKLMKYIGNFVREEIEKVGRVFEEHKRLYRSCFEGTPEQVERKLRAYDYACEVMRP